MPFKDKEKLKEWRRKWWSSLDPERKKEKQEKANNRSKKIKQFLAEYKIEIGCVDCGYNIHHAALDFDHITNDKSFNVCFAKSITQAKKEIKKCEVVCANCHRIRTYNRIQKNKIMKTKVYSAFPGVGKTTYFNTTEKNVLDSDSSKFDKKNFPANYIEHIERNMQDPKVDNILVSSHKDVRDALLKKGIPYVLVYPNRDIKDEYIQRYKDRGNNDSFVDLLNKNWDNWMDEMDGQEGCEKVTLGPGQYLADVID